MEETQKLTASQSLNLDEIKVVPFLTAIRSGNRKLISSIITQKEFEELCAKYMKAEKPKQGNIEKRVEKYQAMAILIQGCFTVFEHLPADEETMEILRDRGYKIDRETYFQDLEIIKTKYKNIVFKYKNEKTRLPKKKKPKEIDQETSIFDMLTALASGLELSLNFDTMTVGEFGSWRKQLKRKQDKIEKNLNKHGSKQ